MRRASLVCVLLACWPGAGWATKRAFVVGVSAYDLVTPLRTPANDARKVADKLQARGFKVTLVTDPDTSRQALVLHWGQFLSDLNADDEVVVYYSGHGIEIRGANYIVPRDVPKAETVKGGGQPEVTAAADRWVDGGPEGSGGGACGADP